MALNTLDKEYKEQFDLREQVRAAIDGKFSIIKIVTCLPAPQYKDFSDVVGNAEARNQALKCVQRNASRIKAYWARGRWFPATGRTFETLKGMVGSKDSTPDIKPKLEFLINNTDGKGCGLNEYGKKVISKLISDARYGTLVDMPASPIGENGERVALTRAQNESGDFLPKWIKYDADQIFYTRGVDEIRLFEVHSIKDPKNEFDYIDKTFIRRLVMIDGVYNNELYDDKEEFISGTKPVANGKNLTEIPFQFFGADDNSPEYSKLPLYDLANENMGHFVLDCDNRSLLHRYSQGMTNIFVSEGDTFAEDNPNGLDVNGDGVNQFGVDDRVEILQLNADGSLPNAMKADEERMIMSGAQVVTDNNVNQTATAKKIDANASVSSLKQISLNATDGIKQLLAWTSLFVGETGESTFKINSDFITDTMTPEMINAHLALVQGLVLPATSLNETARKAGFTELTNDQISKELANQSLLTGGTSEEQATIQAQLDAALEELAALKASE
mgnify:FL=1|tara:strand:- start:477 stop:1985 length:1509 start_codon:yes stop_codon:yes gene_type:complete